MISRRSLLGGVALAPLLARSGFAAAQQSAPWPTDGWAIEAPELHGMDPAALAAVDARATVEVPALSALLASRGGALVWERYYGGQQPGVPINVRSVTKSVTGFLAGAAIDQGFLRGLDQTIGETIPDRIPPGADPRVADVTVRHLLTMTSGIAWAGPDWPTLTGSRDWVAFVLSQPVTGVPGQTYVYNTGGSHLLGVMIAAAVGAPLEEFARAAIFAPAGIEPGGWQRSPQGEVSAGSGLSLTARDMAKFGLLALREGRWDDRQLVPADFVRAATSWQVQGDGTGGWEGYGYQWWITQTWAGYPAAFALGYGGQHVFVVPALDLVVVAAIARRLDPSELRTPRGLIESIAAAVVA